MASSVAVDSEGAATATLVILGLGVLAYQIENRFLPAAALVKRGPDE
jgi:hypothetical protein